MIAAGDRRDQHAPRRWAGRAPELRNDQRNYAVSGMRIPYEFEPALLLGCVGVALVVAVLASLPPARRAGRLTIIRALQYE